MAPSLTSKFSASAKTKTHYETLGIVPQSSAEEIKSAFLTLSKSLHPDFHQNDRSKHNDFVKIMEAYKTLSKPASRSAYDSKLYASQRRANRVGSTNDFFRDFWKQEAEAQAQRPWQDETIWNMRDRSQDKFYEGQPYYGIKGVKRVNNIWIAGGAVCVMLFGALFHFVALRTSTTFSTTQLDEQDVVLGRELKKAKEKALQNGNATQLQLLEARLAKTKD